MVVDIGRAEVLPPSDLLHSQKEAEWSVSHSFGRSVDRSLNHGTRSSKVAKFHSLQTTFPEEKPLFTLPSPGENPHRVDPAEEVPPLPHWQPHPLEAMEAIMRFVGSALERGTKLIRQTRCM